MADNVTFQTTALATPPDATVVATDEVGARHFQLVKQVFGADGTATLVSAADPLPITIISGSSSGTEYTEGDVDVSITGTAMLMEGAANTLVVAQGTATDGLLVNLGSNNDVVISDGGGSITVDGTVAATLSEPISVDDNGGSLTVDGTVAATQSGAWNIADITGTVSLPTGASTAANQTTIIGHLDGVEGLLTTIDGDTGNIVTSVQLLDDTVFAEDVAAQAADKGIAILAVRRDADTSLVGTDNDYANLQVDANGALKVEIFDGGGSHTVDDGGSTISIDDGAGSITVDGTVTIQDGGNTITVDNGGTFAVQESGAALTALQLIDDTVFAEDVAAQAADKGVAILAVRRDADTSLVGTDNDYANLQVDANGALKVEIFDGGGSHTVDNAGTFVVQENGAALTALQIIDDWDETDRAKVNPIVGQAGVAAGAGAVGATTQRVVHGSSSGLTTTQNALSTTAESVIASNSARLFAEVKNADDTINVYLGDDGTVTAANGHLLRPGEAFSFENYTGAIFAIAASGTPTVTTIEW